jgi:hypothetical protein
MPPSSKNSRKRASSDQLRDQANRNVRPAKGKLIKNRLEGPGSSSQRPSSPSLPTPIHVDDSGENSEYEQQESPTDVDEENIDWGEEDEYRNYGKGQKGFQRDARVMAAAGSKSTVLMVVSGQYRA